jgi:hypothetical protein
MAFPPPANVAVLPTTAMSEVHYDLRSKGKRRDDKYSRVSTGMYAAVAVVSWLAWCVTVVIGL